MSNGQPAEPIISWRQAVQSVGQFVITLAGSLLTMMTANDSPITARQVEVAALFAVLAAGAVFGLKFVAPMTTK